MNFVGGMSFNLALGQISDVYKRQVGIQAGRAHLFLIRPVRLKTHRKGQRNVKQKMTTKKERGLLRLFIPAGEAPLLFIQKSDFTVIL